MLMYPFLRFHLCERHIHSYFVNVMHELFLPVLVNWVSYLFPMGFILMRSIPFPALSLLGIVVVLSRSLVYALLASDVICLLSSKVYS